MDPKKLLIHACCGPCAIYTWQLLLTEFETVTPYFYNPNIQPQSEYNQRLLSMKKLSKRIGKPFLHDQSGEQEWLTLTKPDFLEPEGGKRCRTCIKFRLEKTFKKAKEIDYQLVTTTLTVSRHKNSSMIFDLGSQLSDQYNIPFLAIDFKKRNGSAISNRLAKEWELYMQTYCGCSYSNTNGPIQK